MLNTEPEQKGVVAIFLSITTLILLLIVGITVSVLIFGQLKMSTQGDQSIKAFYAADAGAEECLYQAFKGTSADPCYNEGGTFSRTDFANGASFQAQRTASSTSGSALTSLGKFQSASRKVELTWTP